MLKSKTASLVPRLLVTSLAALSFAYGAASAKPNHQAQASDPDAARLSDQSGGDDWAGYGRT